jgi:transposase
MEKQTRNRQEISAEAKKLARERALVILQVRSGMLNAREGAQRLGVSRKTYYEWEERALEAMALALENRPVGRRPGSMDEEKEDLRRHIRELEKKLDLAEKTIEVKELLKAYDSFKGVGSKKNKTKRRQTGRKR